ncbi:MAG: polysaccharide deacetylase family protein, partial [Eubacteriales bacterium]|nr:polysaccharide deacetylase family protein [Eubacteriales bacterium]
MTKRHTGKTTNALSRAWWITMAGLLLCLVVLYAVKSNSTAAVPQVQVQTEPSVTARIAQAKTLLENPDLPPAKLTSTVSTGVQRLALAFEGTPGPGVLDQILDMLSQHNVQATFFLSAVGAAEDATDVQRIIAEGHTLGSYGFEGIKHMEALQQEQLMTDLCRTNATLHHLSGKETSLLKCNATAYTPELLKIAAACGYTAVYDTPHMLSWQSFSSYEDVEAYVKKRERGGIVSIKLSEPLDEMDIRPTHAPTPKPTPAPGDKTAASPMAVPTPTAAPTATAASAALSAYSTDERVLLTAEWVIKALENTKALPETEALREENNGTLADAMHTVYTTKRAVSYLFYGLGNDLELQYLLQSLDDIQAKGTFFVTLNEAQTYEAQIKSIISHGHDLGVAVLPDKSADYYDACTELLHCQQELKTRYGYAHADVVKQPYGTVSDALREAVSAAGCKLITHEVSAVQAADQQAESAEAIMEHLLGEQVISFKRGELIYFAMNYYKKSDRVLGDLAKLLHERINIYGVCSVNEMLSDESLLYTYPVPEDAVLPALNNTIQPGHVGDMEDGAFIKLLRTHYVGNPTTNGKDNLPGFTGQQIRQLNINGKIKNDENAVFLTFDDWGSDRTLTKLLDVLDKHGVKATFYIRTNNTSNNPNLLRAIALAGHEIGSHTDTHYRMASDYNGDGVYESLEEHELPGFQQDINTSYERLP